MGTGQTCHVECKSVETLVTMLKECENKMFLSMSFNEANLCFLFQAFIGTNFYKYLNQQGVKNVQGLKHMLSEWGNLSV